MARASSPRSIPCIGRNVGADSQTAEQRAFKVWVQGKSSGITRAIFRKDSSTYHRKRAKPNTLSTCVIYRSQIASELRSVAIDSGHKWMESETDWLSIETINYYHQHKNEKLILENEPRRAFHWIMNWFSSCDMSLHPKQKTTWVKTR